MAHPQTLAALIHRHRADNSINKAISRLIRTDLVVIDDVGLLPISAEAAEAMVRVIDAAYERRSIALSYEDAEHDLPAAVVAWRRLIHTSGGVLIATPEYDSSLPGQLKNAID